MDPEEFEAEYQRLHESLMVVLGGRISQAEEEIAAMTPFEREKLYRETKALIEGTNP